MPRECNGQEPAIRYGVMVLTLRPLRLAEMFGPSLLTRGKLFCAYGLRFLS
jgi:hypothetical protein